VRKRGGSWLERLFPLSQNIWRIFLLGRKCFLLQEGLIQSSGLWLPRGLRLDAFGDLYRRSVFDIATPEVSFVCGLCRHIHRVLAMDFPVSYQEI